MTEYPLGRRPEFDPRSRRYNIAAVIPAPVPRSYTWGCQYTLDQGPDGACVGFAVAHELGAKPKPVHGVNYLMGMNIYWAAQQLDPWPGEDYEGTSVLAGMKAAQSMGYIGQYRWAFTTQDALAAISRHGPAVIGINWYSGMFDPDTDGYLHPTGQVEGGHAVCVRGVNTKAKTVLIHNSWGPDWHSTHWGPGTALLSWDDFDRLLNEDGECVIPLDRRL